MKSLREAMSTLDAKAPEEKDPYCDFVIESPNWSRVRPVEANRPRAQTLDRIRSALGTRSN